MSIQAIRRTAMTSGLLGGSKATNTRREPQRGHFIPESSRAIGKSAPRVQTSVSKPRPATLSSC